MLVQAPRPAESGDLQRYLLDCLDEVCIRLAEKFDLYDSTGKPRRAFILDSLLKLDCLGCLWKVLANAHMRNGRVDALYGEMHSLAVNLLSGVLMQTLGDCDVCCEENGEYGRTDITVKPAKFGVVVEAYGRNVVVEVKTGRSVSFAQIFRYLLQHPDTVVVVWRVSARQVFALEGGKMKALLSLVVSSAISRALRLLECDVLTCSHNPLAEDSIISDPQALLDNFFNGLAVSLPKAVKAVIQAVGGCGFAEHV